MRRALVAAVLVGLAAAPTTAHAAYGPGAVPVSVDNTRLEQGDAATTFAQVSANGRYVVFQTRASNFFADDDPDPPGLERRGGIFRYDRFTGALALVADGDMVRQSDGVQVLRGAGNPSITADGRWVAFSTAQRLVGADTNDNVDVYVRDLTVPLTTDRAASGAYTLVSARDGTTTPATYAPRDPPLPGRTPGVDVWPGTAISADGTKVAFRSVELANDLPARPSADTPPGEVFVRDLPARHTALVSQTPAGDPAGGASGPVVVSGDGSTVAWVGANAQAQTRFFPSEPSDPSIAFYLWRRWNDPVATTRRITGVADPDDPSCPAGGDVSSDSNALGPCDGPLTDTEQGPVSIGQAAPALSQDGYDVAFLASGGLRPLTVPNDPGLDLYTTSMRPGQTRKRATRVLTREGAASDSRANGPIESVTMSADGHHLAVTTTRDSFVLPALSPVGSFRTVADGRELYVVDLTARTIQRVITDTAGGDADGSVANNAWLDAGGSVACFVSSADDLFYGDANRSGDAFCATRQVDQGTSTPPPGSGQPPGDFTFDPKPGKSPRRLRLAVAKAGSWSVRLTVRVPGAGRITAIARSGKGKGHVVARRSATADRAGVTRLTLALLARFRHGARVRSTISVRWSPPPPAAGLKAGTAASFAAPARQHRRHRATTRRSRR